MEECAEGNGCNIHPVAVNATSLELESADATYKLVVYQHGQEIVKSDAFQEALVLDGKFGCKMGIDKFRRCNWKV